MTRACVLAGLLAGCARLAGVGDVVEAPCEDNTPIDFAQAGLPTTSLDLVDDVFAADLNGDGRLDLVVVRTDRDGAASTSVLIDQAAPGDKLASFGIETALVPGRAQVADLDGDGRLDVVASCLDQPCFRVWRNTTSAGGALALAPPVEVPGGTSAYVAVGDFTGDGKPDVITLGRAGGAAQLWPSTTTASEVSFDRAIVVIEGTVDEGIALRIADLNADGQRTCS